MPEKKQTLWDISEEMLAFDQLLADADIDDPEVQEVLAKWGEEIMGDLEGKADNYAAFIQILLARADARLTEGQRLVDRAKTDTNNAKRLKEHMKRIFEFHKVKKVETPRFQITVAKNGGKQPIEVNVLPEDLPDELRTSSVVYKKAGDVIRDKLLAGEEIPGCRLLERGTGLRIK